LFNRQPCLIELHKHSLIKRRTEWNIHTFRSGVVRLKFKGKIYNLAFGVFNYSSEKTIFLRHIYVCM